MSRPESTLFFTLHCYDDGVLKVGVEVGMYLDQSSQRRR